MAVTNANPNGADTRTPPWVQGKYTTLDLVIIDS